MDKEAPQTKPLLFTGAVLTAGIVIFAMSTCPKGDTKTPQMVASAKHFKMHEDGVKTFEVNPVDPYDPMPLRVATVGATAYHRPFCPYAKQSLAAHGLEKRINYLTREEVAESKRPADKYCMAGVFDCSDVDPAEFAASGNDPWCGANLRSSHYNVAGVDAAIAGKILCNLQGHIGLFVNEPDDCVNGMIRASDASCDHDACGACTSALTLADCVAACDGCNRVTLAPLNKVTLYMGDANRDGQTSVDDYLYYHECYSGPIAATIPCQNVFDFDNDADVDTDDFELFTQAYNTGNISWATANHPDAVINQPKLELPLRVGTDGSAIYHRIDCPAVNNSWQIWGIAKRADYYTWDQIESSGRVPDTNICLPGTRHDPSGALQNCSLDSDGDGMLNCDDECSEDQLKTEPGICGCGVSDNDSDNNGTPDCNDPVSILYENNFDTAGEPVDWFDTGADNGLVEAPSIFSVTDQGSFIAFGTSLDLTNVHSHHIKSETWAGYKYSGRMMANGTPNIGVTFFSDYPNSDTYYRLRNMGGTFSVSSHGTTITSGDTETDILAINDIWYNFVVWVGNTASGTGISAKIWADGDQEPTWQVSCFDNSVTKRTQGSFGVWSMGAGNRYWDNIKVTNY